MLKIHLLLITLLSSLFIHGASGDGIPFGHIGTQLFNFSIFIGILVYIIIKKVPQALKQNYNDFIEMNSKAQNLYNKALKSQKELIKKQTQLDAKEATFEEDLKKEVIRLEKFFEQQTKEKCAVILKAAQDFEQQEWIRQNNRLQSEFLSSIEKTSKDICSRSTSKKSLHLGSIGKEGIA